MTRAARITPRTHYEQGGLLRADRKYGGQFSDFALFAANRLKFVPGEKSAFTCWMSMMCMWVRRLQLLNKNQKHMVVLQVNLSLHVYCNTDDSIFQMMSCKASLVIKYIHVAAHPAFPTFI